MKDSYGYLVATHFVVAITMGGFVGAGIGISLLSYAVLCKLLVILKVKL